MIDPDTNDTAKVATAATAAALLVDDLVAALVNVRIYQDTHPRVQGSLAAVRRHLREIGTSFGEDPVRIRCVDDLLVFGQEPLLGASFAAARLLDLLHQWGSGGLEFAAGVGADELNELLGQLVARPQDGDTFAQLNERLQARNCRHVRLLPPAVEVFASAETARPAAPVRTAVRFWQHVVDLLQNVTVGVCRGGHIDFDPVKTESEQLLARLESDDGPLLGLTLQDQYDAFTFGHSARVAVLSMNFARTLTDDRDLLIRIGMAALLHDVGKSLVPFELLNLPRPLTADEKRQVGQHPQLGAELLLDHHDSDPLAIAAAFGHHIDGAGKGYPRTVHEHHTSLVTEIVKICDVYEALTAARPYKRPMSPVRVYRVMLGMGERFHRGLLRKFIEVNGIFPCGQLVALQSGELARVQRQGKDLTRPVVEIVTDGQGRDLDLGERELIDLGALGCSAARTVIGEALLSGPGGSSSK